MKNLPVYKHPASYAREHDELAAYRASNQANAACKEAIEAAIRDHYRDNRLDTAAVDQVVQQFGYDRTFHVLAITVCQADWDRRYSPDNWACAVHKIADGGLRYAAFHIKLILRHATLLHQLNQPPADGFIQLQVPHLPSL